MRLAIWFVLLFAVAVVAATAFGTNDGLASFYWSGWRLDLSLNLFLLLLVRPAVAQDLFSPVIVVNDRAVTGFELDQRQRLLQLFGTPGDLSREARTQLVEDRLKQQELDRVLGGLAGGQ